MPQLPPKDVYRFMASFEKMVDFLKFAREELVLQNYEINGILDQFKEIEEQKYQIISLWKSRKGREATIRRLYELKQQAAERQNSSEESSSVDYRMHENNQAGPPRTIAEVRTQVSLLSPAEDEAETVHVQSAKLTSGSTGGHTVAENPGIDSPVSQIDGKSPIQNLGRYGASSSRAPMGDMPNTSATSTSVKNTPEPTNESHPQPSESKYPLKTPTPQNYEIQNTTSEYSQESEHQPAEGQSSTNTPHIEQHSGVQEGDPEEASSNPPDSETCKSQTKATGGETSPPTPCGTTSIGQQYSSGTNIKKEIQNVIDNYISICDSVLPNVVVDYDPSGKSPDLVKNDRRYPVSEKPVKGYIMILNNTFEKVRGHNERKGSEVDMQNLKKLWNQMGGCQIIDNSNLSAKQMLEEIDKFVKSKRRKDCGFVAFFVMSHGNCDYYVENNQTRKGEGYFLGNDGEKVMIFDVLKMLENGYPGTTLEGIPKLIFFQICRGGDLRHEFETRSLPPVHSDGPTQHEGSLTTDNTKAATGDVLQGYATQPGYKSMRDETKGSWYINAIVNIFSKHARDEHVLDLMTYVHWAVSERIGKCEGRSCMQISEAVTSLSGKLYLCPDAPY